MPSIISEIAWDSCQFCSMQRIEIAKIIADSERWKEIPIQYKCAWDRVCQVGFGRFRKKKIWKDLCKYRGEQNNLPSSEPYQESEWLETECECYKKAKKEIGL